MPIIRKNGPPNQRLKSQAIKDQTQTRSISIRPKMPNIRETKLSFGRSIKRNAKIMENCKKDASTSYMQSDRSVIYQAQVILGYNRL